MNSRNVNRNEENVVKGHGERSEPRGLQGRVVPDAMPWPALPNHPSIEVPEGHQDTRRNMPRTISLKMTILPPKNGHGFRFQPDKGSVLIVTCFSVLEKASPDNKSCILLGLLSFDFFSGVAWLTGSSSMVGRPSEDQLCDLNRKWK